MKTAFTEHAGVEIPLIGGAMFPCSNPELVAAVSKAGGLGVIQPVSMIYVHKHELREGIRLIKSITEKPIGFNALVEKSSKRYEERMREWVDIALDEGVRFFITALGKPDWVVKKVHAVGGIVYHDITEKKFALKAIESGVDGLICVNNRAGGHAGKLSPEELYSEISGLGLPIVLAGGVGDAGGFKKALDIGYAAVQVGTRFIATTECTAHEDYKMAIINAKEDDIVLTEKLSGVPVSIIETEYVKKSGTKAGFFGKILLKGSRSKHWMRMFYTLLSFFRLRKASLQGGSYKEYFQAGKSVNRIDSVESVATVVQRFAAIL